jgi:hypothetical protein
MAGDKTLPWKQAETAREEWWRYQASRQRGKHERQPPNIFWGGHTGRVAESGFRPEPTPRAYRGERVTGQAPCYPVLLTMPSVRIHSPVCSVEAPRSGRARVGIQPGRIVCSWPLVRLFGPGYPVPALCTVSPVRQKSPVRPVPVPHTCRAKGLSSQDELCQLCAPDLRCSGLQTSGASTVQCVLSWLYSLCLQCAIIAQCILCQLSTLTELEWVSSQDVLRQLHSLGCLYVSSFR